MCKDISAQARSLCNGVNLSVGGDMARSQVCKRVKLCASERQCVKLCEQVRPWECMRLNECAGTLVDKPAGDYVMV